MPDLRLDEYWQDLEREHKASIPHLTLKEEVEAFEAEGIIKELLALARATGDLALEARMNRYVAAMADRPDYRVRDEDIAYVRSLPIVSFLEGRGVKVNKIGYACCPIHHEKTPSFRVYKNNSWFCFGCAKGGDIITLLMALDNLSFREAVRQLR